MKTIQKKELMIGLTVLITLLILFFGIDYLKGVNVFKAANYYYASYTNVAGLAQSAPVTVNGYKVGLVREINYEYDNPGHIKVELSLDRKLQVPVGTEAVLVTDMLGTSSIELRMGKDTRMHQVGDKLAGVNSSGLMDNVTNDILPSVASALPKIDSLLTAVTAIVSDPALLGAVKRLDAVMANLERSTTALSATMARTPAIASDAQTTMNNVRQISADLTQVTAALREMPLDSTMANVQSLTARLNELSGQLQSRDSSLGLLLNDPSLYNSLNGAVGSLDSLLQDVKRHPKRYISIKLL